MSISYHIRGSTGPKQTAFSSSREKKKKMKYLSVLSLIAVHKDFRCHLVQERKKCQSLQPVGNNQANILHQWLLTILMQITL